jgi:alpha-L-arabinofuranosidase
LLVEGRPRGGRDSRGANLAIQAGAQIFGDALDGSGKVMGLAPYGHADIAPSEFFKVVLNDRALLAVRTRGDRRNPVHLSFGPNGVGMAHFLVSPVMRVALLSWICVGLCSCNVNAPHPTPGGNDDVVPFVPTHPVDEPTTVRIVARANTVSRSVSPVLQGANINVWYRDANGLWDRSAKAPNADVAAKAAKAGLGLLRFPGGTAANLFDWKRSVGPLKQRRCQTDASTFEARADRDYGASEFMALVRTVGAEPQIMVPFANGSPESAADLVEFMNAPLGTNPNGGIAWAEVRAAAGSPAPYHATRWEIGNEQDRGGHQAYWMASNDGVRRLAQYIDGDTIDFVDEPLGRDCELETPTLTTTAGGQTYYFRYSRIKKGTSPVVKVGGVVWTQVTTLSSSGPTDQVYEWDRELGAVVFGDGLHGSIPPPDQPVTASYTFEHLGFVALFDAMKKVASETGVDISICAAWAPPSKRGSTVETQNRLSFAKEMARRGLSDRYDCVAAHPYTNFGRDFESGWRTPGEGHQEHMLGDLWSRTMISTLTDDLRTYSAKGFVTISEMGALWFTEGADRESSLAVLPQYSSTMSHALFMASQWMHFATLGVRWIEGNTLVSEPGGLRGVFGGSATGFIYGAEAMTREALKPVFATGSQWVSSAVENNPSVPAGPEQWPALAVGASKGADGALRIVVINRQAHESQVVQIVPEDFDHGAAIELATVGGASFSSYVDGAEGSGDDTVKLVHSEATVTSQRFTVELPAASITVVTLRMQQ